MKKLRILLLTALLALLLLPVARAASYLSLNVVNDAGQSRQETVRIVSLRLDDQPLEPEVPAFILGGRTLVPVRILSEKLGADVTWKPDSRQIQIENARTSITLTIGSSQAVVNGETVRLYGGVPATLASYPGSRSAKTMVPIRFVSEQLGAKVDFDDATFTVLITSPQEETYTVAVPAQQDGLIRLLAEDGAEANVFTLPGRVVIDYPGGLFSGSSAGKLEIDGSAVTAVRYNQYDHGYDALHVARIVLDLREGATIDDLTIQNDAGSLFISQSASSQPADPDPDPNPEPDLKPAEPDIPLVVLDAGHGGTDTGAPYFDHNEKDLVLPITLQVGGILTNAGYRVEYTRTDDSTVSLAARTEQANTQGATIFVSIHANAFAQKPEVNGLETYYLVGGERSAALAQAIHEAVLSATAAADRGVRTANFYVLRNTDMPAVLVETGYMTNESECSLLADPDYQTRLAQGIAAGIRSYLSAQ